MTAATQGRNTKRRSGERVGHIVNPGSTIHAGTLVALLTANGNAVPAGTAGAGNAVGVAEESVVGNGSALVDTWRGAAFLFANSAAADAVARADIGANAF
ncbi:MAG: hypothetical protein ACREPD_06075, partial [Stenotrophomonas sp.]|uniref:hypothetical protein n=1 Tax=Stenotrophomonas sp. TaxID=69392 RepID=UPI003D6D4043